MDKKHKYRFKTEDELKKEFGCQWYKICGMNNKGYMDYLLGTEIDIPFNIINKNGDVCESFDVMNNCLEYPRQRTWSIVPDLIIKLDVMPNYERKTFIYE